MKTTEEKSAQSEIRNKKKDTDQAEGLRELFVDELQDIYWAEKALTEAIPKMIKNASDDELAEALEEHLEATKVQVKRLEKVFSEIGEKATAKKCKAMVGLINEAEQIMEETEKGLIRDAGIISAGQKVEHYEIASYGTLCAYAKKLGEKKVAALLHETLEEEKEADETLSGIAESMAFDLESENNKEKIGSTRESSASPADFL